MNTKPILFNSDMVRALLDGSKTQTRRVAKPQPKKNEDGTFYHPHTIANEKIMASALSGMNPYGQPGDLLWVRETFKAFNKDRVHFKADYAGTTRKENTKHGLSWKPSIHMPRWASRLTLKITDVRVERVQDITDEDAKSEGAKFYGHIDIDKFHKEGFRDPPRWSLVTPNTTAQCLSTPKWAFANLWNSINEKRGLGWDANPWVWVVEFEVIKQNVDEYITGE